MKEVLDQFGFGVVICDECHYLKNQRAARTKVTAIETFSVGRKVCSTYSRFMCVALTLVLIRADCPSRFTVQPRAIGSLSLVCA